MWTVLDDVGVVELLEEGDFPDGMLGDSLVLVCEVDFLEGLHALGLVVVDLAD